MYHLVSSCTLSTLLNQIYAREEWGGEGPDGQETDGVQVENWRDAHHS